MSRIEFMEKLEYLLQDIPDEEKTDALAYYQDYFAEAGDENEEQVIREFGSPERIAAIIRAELSGNLEDGGGFTETGYQDERFREPGYQVAKHHDLPEIDETADTGQHDAEPGYRRNQDSPLIRLLKLAGFLIVLSILGPIALGAGGAALSVAAAIVITLIVLVLLVGFGTVLCCLLAVALIVCGIAALFVNPFSGIFILGFGIFLLGCSFIGIVLSSIVYGRMVPFCIRGITDRINRFVHRDRRRAR